MRITAERPPIDVIERRFTVEDLGALPSELPSGPVLYELDNGRLVKMSPPGDVHGMVEANLVRELGLQGRAHGKVRCGEVGVVLWRDPDRVVGADAVFLANSSPPVRRSKEGYLLTIPDLVVEVVSRNDTPAYLERKVSDYLAAGVRVVWVAHPDSRTVSEHRPEQPVVTWTAGQTLTLEDVIPGFRLPVEEVFAE